MKFIFGSGLPRSGSTLACNIINQRPDVYASPTSGLYQVVKPILTGWEKIPEFKANANDQNKHDLLRAVFKGYYKQYNKDIVIDKCRAWPSEIESLEYIFGIKPKVILFVRDVRDILSSWEKMYRRDKRNGKPTPGENEFPGMFITVEKRMEFWSTTESPLGSAFNVMKDALHRGLSEYMYFFEYEKWTSEPEKEFNLLYEWLEIPPFKHDFKNIKQVLFEKDEYYGYQELHNIKEGELKKSEPQWPKYMTKELSDKYESSNIWKK
jgi:sulfotransferase